MFSLQYPAVAFDGLSCLDRDCKIPFWHIIVGIRPQHPQSKTIYWLLRVPKATILAKLAVLSIPMMFSAKSDFASLKRAMPSSGQGSRLSNTSFGTLPCKHEYFAKIKTINI